jgi:recombinational DNA repair protein (RecF pathway)
MKGHFRGPAIVLSRREVGEADRIVQFCDRGREAISARGVESHKRSCGLLEPAMEADYMC